MRRRKQEIVERAALDDILARGIVCHVGLAVANRPYVVPVNYAHDAASNCLYLHGARAGLKVDMLRQNPDVCFEVEVDVALKPAEAACSWSVRYRSVIGFGAAHRVEDAAEKVAALDAIMRHYGGPPGPYPAETLAKTLVIKIAITSLTGKQAGY